MATLDDLQRIESAYSSGLLTIRDKQGRLKTFQSIDELRKVRDELRAELGVPLPPGQSRGFRVKNQTYKKGVR